jgi:hypothetical protein
MFSFFRKRHRRDALHAAPLPSAWLRILHENVLLYQLLSEAEQAKLHQLIPRFIRGKHWQGWQGLTITEEMQVAIAAQACLLVLGLDNYLFENLKTIRVYPGSFFCGGPVLGVATPREPIELSW